MRIKEHPILGSQGQQKTVTLIFNSKRIEAYEGEMIATAILATGTKVLRYSTKYNEPRGIFCAIGRCTDCVMEVNGRPNIRTCITPVEEGMVVNTQHGAGVWKED